MVKMIDQEFVRGEREGRGGGGRGGGGVSDLPRLGFEI
jgi:hypothetical protein